QEEGKEYDDEAHLEVLPGLAKTEPQADHGNGDEKEQEDVPAYQSEEGRKPRCPVERLPITHHLAKVLEIARIICGGYTVRLGSMQVAPTAPGNDKRAPNGDQQGGLPQLPAQDAKRARRNEQGDA